MKTLWIIGGTMGVGKTTVCQILKRRLPDSVFLDGDWCWDADPFQVTAETKEMVLQNIAFLLNNFLHCSAYENVLFGWVLHEQSIWDDLLRRLDVANCRVVPVALVCSADALSARLQRDIDAGRRTPDVIPRSTARLPLYQNLRASLLETTGLTAAQAAEAVIALATAKPCPPAPCSPAN